MARDWNAWLDKVDDILQRESEGRTTVYSSHYDWQRLFDKGYDAEDAVELYQAYIEDLMAEEL